MPLWKEIKGERNTRMNAVVLVQGQRHEQTLPEPMLKLIVPPKGASLPIIQ